MKPIRLNLASRPLRNRRLFLFAGGGLVLAAFVALFLGVFIFSHFALKLRGARSELARVNQAMQSARREKSASLLKVQEARARNQRAVDFANAIILEKSFSWAEFLSRLEEGLPDSSFILSLAPVAVESQSVQFRLKVASAGLNDQLALINKLLELNFSRIRVETEDVDDRGFLTSELVVSYERNI
jgi:Tfp pilus assembly protein PilN